MTYKRLLAVFPICFVAACGGGGGSSSPPPPPPPPQNQAPVISGTPLASIGNGSLYSFQPTATDADGDSLTFTIQNQPGWLDFDSSSGSLIGTAFAGDIGVYDDVIIEVSDGTDSNALPAFSVEVTSNPVTFEIEPAGAISVNALNVVSMQVLSNGRTSYVLSVEIDNQSGQDYTNVTASLDRRPENLSLFNRVDETIQIAQILSGETMTPSDTFQVEVSSGGIEQFEKLVVEFDDDSLDGIDSDSNGYRDDVETLINSEFAGVSEIEIQKLNDLASSLGSILTQPVTLQALRARESEIEEIVHCLEASQEEVNRILPLLNFLVFDTGARRTTLSTAQQQLANAGLSLVSFRADLDEVCINRYGI